jgi:putative transposase
VVGLIKKSAGATTFAVLPKRWIVERTFAWLGRNRRLSQDDEALPETGEAWIRVAMIPLTLKRLAPQ